jgi:hypothetical protein|nr:MAG TPA: hypothetical protein [Caudoviricetes sp.]
MITNIRKRQLELTKMRKTSDNYAGLYNIVSENHNMTQAETVFKNILELDSNIDTAIMKSVDLLLELYKYNDPVVVNKHRQKVLESITKVRDANQFKNYLQRKMALHKGRVKNKVSNIVDKVHNDLKDGAKKAASNIASAVPGNSGDGGEQAAHETLNMMYKVACENVTYDRIIKNYEKIGKRFDIDKIVIEKVFTKDDAVRETARICKLIDTYNMSSINKFKVATENYLFVLSKNACPYNTVDIVEAAADYFLLNSDDKELYSVALESTLNDMANYNPFGSSDISKIVDKINKPKETDLDEVIDFNTNRMDAYIAQFKHVPTHSEFVRMIETLPNVVGMKTYINHMDIIFDTLNMINDDTTQYFITLLKFNEALLSCYEGKDKVDLIKSLLAIYEQYANKIDKDIVDRMRLLVANINESVDESLITLPAKIDMLLESLESLSEKDANSLIEESFDRFSLNDIDGITQLTKLDPSVIKPSSYQTVLKDTLRTARRKQYKTFEDYEKIDCIKDNLNKLKDIDDSSDEDMSLDEAIISTKVKEACVNSLYDFTKYPTTLKEMNIVNTIAMASEKVKAKLSDVSADVSNLSRQFDAQMDQLKGVVNTKDLESENREAVIAGNILPKASRIIKLAITAGVGYFINPAISVIVVLGYLGMSLDAQSKERRKVLEEIELELEMTNRYLKKAEDDGSLEKQRELLKIKKKLESQKARLMYNMAFKHGEALPGKNKDDD